MLTRRRILSIAPVSALASARLTAETALPPAVASLPNRKGEAHPISLAERESRIERARLMMRAHGIDAIALAGGTSLDYFTGIRWGNSERLFTMLLPQKGAPTFVCPAFEEARVREKMTRVSKIITWQEDDDPYAKVAQALRDAGVATGSSASRNGSRSSSQTESAKRPTQLS